MSSINSINLTSTSRNALKIKLEINGTKQAALLDTGASCNTVSTHMVEKLNLITYDIEEQEVSTSNGTIKCATEAQFTIKIGNDTHKIQALVLPNQNNDVIIGMPFMLEKGVVIDMSKDKVLITQQTKRVENFETLLNEMKEIMSQSVYRKTAAKNVEHTINVKTDVNPQFIRNYRTSPDKEKFVKKQIEEWTANGIITRR